MTAEQIFRGLEQMRYDAGQIISNTHLGELKKIASGKGLIISDNKASGNCMFYALSEQLSLVKGIQISHEALRQHIVQYLKENPTLVSYNVVLVMSNKRVWFHFMVIQIKQSNKMVELEFLFLVHTCMPNWLTERNYIPLLLFITINTISHSNPNSMQMFVTA